MKNVVFVAPYLMDATERFIASATKVADARVGLVSCDPPEKLASAIRQRLAGYHRVQGIGAEDLAAGVNALRLQLGSVDRLLGMLEQIQVALGQIRDEMGIDGMGAQVARNFRDKARMKDVLRSSGIPCARHRMVQDVRSGVGFAAEFGYPVIVKPPAGAGAQGTFRCESEAILTDCLQTLDVGGGNSILIEEYIQGREHSFDSICVNGNLLWSSISHYFPGPLDVVREPWIQWCVVIPRETEVSRYQPIQQIAPAALQALGMKTGLSHMEWFLRGDGSIAISEVGARPPGAQFTSLISWAHDFDLYQAWADLMIHELVYIPERKYAAGAAYLRGMGRGRVVRVEGLQEIEDQLGDIVVESRIPKPGQNPSGSYEGEGFIIVRHPQTSVVEHALELIIKNVQVVMSETDE